MHGEIEEAATGDVMGLSAAAGCSDEPWCARSMRFCGRAVERHVFRFDVSFLDVLLTDTYFRMNEICSKPSQSVNRGTETCANRKSSSPCLLAIPAFDRIIGLSKRHLHCNGGIYLH